ncbi:type I restriction-modification system subunit M [Bifidobacterium callimiconis]|uniref:site-specific DNA-methyltransferase (adenine-specific) n=1 Tax=Bifidobacterium callimiconis TaxID=2306973 RepID=A0A430FFM4_9BIFI|nr:type I restriction-modification system subunit M N-terminal domain-containing protein [Bifidobacterium callimiconis]RSX51538.1 restriction endonuclease subunit M [Bifidobacterium callimiconis]
MNHQSIVSFIWQVADLLRGDYKQHEYGDIILPFTVLRRLDCVLEPTKDKVLAVEKSTQGMSEGVRERQLENVAELPFYNTSRYTMSRLRADPSNIAENLNDYVQKFSKDALDVFEKFDFFNRVDSLAANNLLFQIVDKFCTVDLGPAAVDDAEMGDIYENLLRRFSEMSNETAGEHFSPRDGLKLAVDLLIAGAANDLSQGNKVVRVYDPCAGTGGALSLFDEQVQAYYPNTTVLCYGQELNPATFATCKADIMLRGGGCQTYSLWQHSH